MGDVNALAPMWGCHAEGNGCSVPGDIFGNLSHPDKDTPFCDRVVGDAGLEMLGAVTEARRSGGPPFFLAVGFRKPHLPHRHPSAYDALYPSPDNITLAKYPVLDNSVPPIAFHQTSLAVDPYAPIPTAAAQLERRNYYASVSWIDHQIGAVLEALEDSGLSNETAVVFHSDHVSWTKCCKGTVT